MAIKQILWTEKYRPQKLDDLIVPNRIMEKFKNGITQHMLFTGSPGLGKTSAAWALIKEFNNPHLYINASTDTGIDVVRNRITDFCANRSIMDEPGLLKIVFLDECLDINEKVRIGTIDNWQSIALKDLDRDKIYSCISMNTETGELENDTCEIISEREAELYEVELEDGRSIRVTSCHPFMIKLSDGSTIQKTIDEGLSSTDDIICF